MSTESSSIRQPERKRRRSSSRGKRSDSYTLRAVDASLLLAIFGVPFLLGGRIALGEVTLVLSSVCASLFWTFHLIQHPESGWIKSRSGILLIAIVALLLVQVTPLPGSLVTTVSPQIADTLPLWNSTIAGSFGEWNYLSLNIGATRRNIVSVLACLLLFVVTVQRIRRTEDAERLMSWICISAVLMCVFGMIQYLTANGLYYWFYKFPGGTTIDRVKGAFPNKNHFAQFAALSIGPLIAWCMTIGRTSDGQQSTWGQKKTGIPHEVAAGIIMGGLAIVLSSMLLARSRGAVLACVAGTSVMMAVLYFRSMISKKLILALCGMGGLTGIILLAVGYQSIVNRLDNWNDSGRYLIWKANLEIISDFPVLGTGIGSHQYIHHRYLDQPYARGEYTHAESGFLQIASETGLVGLGITALCLVVCFYWCARGVRISQSRNATIALTAITCSLIVSCVQSLFDFVWYIQGCMVPVAILMGCACRLYQIENARLAPDTPPKPLVIPRPVIVCTAGLLVVCGSWMLGRVTPAVAAEPHWRLYRYLTLDADAEEEWRRVGGDMELAESASTFRTKLLAMHQAVKADPDDARYQLRLGLYYHALFHLLQQRTDNPMTLSQLQDAGINNGFESQEEMHEWLNRAVGPNLEYALAARRHFRRSVELNPLQVYGYLFLSELEFLRPVEVDPKQRLQWDEYVESTSSFSRACVAQSLILRPYNGQVLFAAGRDALADRDFETALDFWKRSFHRDVSVQRRITQLVAQFVTQDVARFIQESFDPDVEALKRVASVFAEYKLREDEEQILQVLSERLVARARQEDNRNRVDDWLAAASTYDRLGQPTSVASCLESAMDAAPSNFVVRLEYAAWKLQTENQPQEALEHLEWCRRLRPKNEKVLRLLERAQRGAYSGSRIRPVSATSEPKSRSEEMTAPFLPQR